MLCTDYFTSTCARPGNNKNNIQGVKTSMEKSRISPVAAGRGIRMSYSRQKEVLEMPNLIEVQKDSYKWFLEAGLKEVFDDISPITDYSGQLSRNLWISS